MSYNKAMYILPNNLIEKVQEYVDGEFIYIPRKPSNKKEWGAKTSTRQELYNEILIFMKTIWRVIIHNIYLKNIFYP
ncbi:hypothetical protein [Clostridium sp. CF011]|uniref:hypothetical protein n=1 Tax=Clostridium sp. CF011 TaxID=2843318 RepID=UPI00344FD8A0